MTKIEMDRRLDTMSETDIVQVRKFINDGFGATGIRFETNMSIKQINAVFALVHNNFR